MKTVPTELEGVVIIEPQVFHDDRGFFVETYNSERYAEQGIDVTFVQDNQSRSTKDTLRGLHAQLHRPQAKLVRALQGSIFDVAVDIRRGSPTFGNWVGVTLSAGNFRQLFVPIGYAHGFCVTSEIAEVEYKCSDFYDPRGELRLRWDDSAIGVSWPTDTPVLSPKDEEGLPLSAWTDQLPLHAGPPR